MPSDSALLLHCVPSPCGRARLREVYRHGHVEPVAARMLERIYADHAATTPVRDDVVAAMLPYFGGCGYNASSLHAEGRAARAALDQARLTVAGLLGARPGEIVFTGGGSEANNLAILGAALAAQHAERVERPRALTVATEHRAVLHAVAALEGAGFAVDVLPVDGEGRLSPQTFAAALGPRTRLASVMLANNEIGTLQPVADLAGLARERGVLFHCDAIQAPGRLACDVGALGVDLLSLSAHKCYGPKGVGALYVRSGVPLAAQLLGGPQEAGRRAGTENVAGAVGFARAYELAEAERALESVRLSRLRTDFERVLHMRFPGVWVNAAGAPRLPGISSCAFPDVAATDLLIALDLAGAAASAGSACAAGAAEPSHVLAALAAPAWVRRGTVRFSFGRSNGEQDVERLAEMLEEVLPRLREPVGEVGTTRTGSVASRSEVHS